MTARLHIWWQAIKRHSVPAVIALLVGVLVFIVFGYQFHWNWTGFETKTLWDWLQLGSSIATTLAIVAAAVWFV